MGIKKEAWLRRAEGDFWFRDFKRTSPLTPEDISRTRSNDLLSLLESQERRYDRQSFDEWRQELDGVYDELESRGILQDEEKGSLSEQERLDRNLAYNAWFQRKKLEDPEWYEKRKQQSADAAKNMSERSRLKKRERLRRYQKKKYKEDPEFAESARERARNQHEEIKRRMQEDPAFAEQMRAKYREKNRLRALRKKQKLETQDAPAPTPALAKPAPTPKQLRDREFARLQKIDQKVRSEQDQEFSKALKERRKREKERRKSRQKDEQ